MFIGANKVSTKPSTDREVAAFKSWLEGRGHTILPCKGEWELLRWNDAPGVSPRILYTNKRGGIANWNNRAAVDDWLEFNEEQHQNKGTK